MSPQLPAGLGQSWTGLKGSRNLHSMKRLSSCLCKLRSEPAAPSPPRAVLSHAPCPSPEPEISATASCSSGQSHPPPTARLYPQLTPFPSQPEPGRLLLPSCLLPSPPLPAAHNYSLTPPPTLSSFSTGEFAHILPPFYSINVIPLLFLTRTSRQDPRHPVQGRAGK